jgi:AraC family transcriptional regulator
MPNSAYLPGGRHVFPASFLPADLFDGYELSFLRLGALQSPVARILPRSVEVATVAMATPIPAIWNKLAENMYLNDLPTADIKLSELASFTFGRIQTAEGLPDIARPMIGELGYVIALQLKPIPYVEHFIGTKKVSGGFYPVGAVSVIDLSAEPACLLPTAFDSLALYVTQTALDEVAYDHGMPRVERLIWPYGTFDPVVHHLGQALVASLEQPHASRIFVDHVLHALHCHFVCSYGGVTKPALPFRGGLSFAQTRRATELLEAHLDGKIALRDVAEACQLSVSHFSRAFRQTFHKPPYQWLTERRVDKAKALMIHSQLPLADVAMQCGFADQSSLNRSFKRIYGVTPGEWRRSAAGTSTGRTARFSRRVN